MAQDARHMSDLNIGGRSLPRLDAADEIAVMGVRLFAAVGRQRLLQVVNLPSTAIDDQRSLFAVKSRCCTASFESVGTPQSMFPDDCGAGVREMGDVRVGRFLVVAEVEFAAGGRNPRRQIDVWVSTTSRPTLSVRR